MRSLRLLTLLVVVVSFALNFAVAQSSTTSLRGTVLDKTHASIAKATVTLSNPEQGFTRTTATGDAGGYEFLQIPPGTYNLLVQMAGFRKSERRNIQLLINTPATIDVTLDVGSISETVEVTGEAPLVNTTDASLGNAFGSRQVNELPLEGRNVPDLLSLQAGVAYTGNRSDIDQGVDTRNGAVNGARSDQSNITLDGTGVNDERNGYAFTSVLPITADSVQEFRVTTANYNADEGRSSGAQVSMVTKSGTNNFHGSVYEYLRNTATSANDYFVKQAELATGEPNKPLKLIRNIPGASVGGPIVKDRFFFFLNYEGARQREEDSVVRIVPSPTLRDGVMLYQCGDPSQCPGGTVQGVSATHAVAPGYMGLSPATLQAMDPLQIGPNPVMLNYFNSFPLPNDTSLGDGFNYDAFRFRGPIAKDTNWYIARADFRVTRDGKHNVFWRGALRNDTQSNVPYLPGTAPLQKLLDYSKGFTVGYTAALRPTLLNSFHWGYTRQSAGTVGINDTQSFIFLRGLNDNSTPNNSSLAPGNSGARSLNYQVPVQNLLDDVSWAKGKHTLQFGGNIAFIRNPQLGYTNSFSSATANASVLISGGIAGTGTYMDPGCTNPTINCLSLPAVAGGFGNSYDYPLMALIGSVDQINAQYNFDRNGSILPQGTAVKRRFAQNSFEFYAQDSWKVRPNLTLAYGLRYSLFSPPWEANGEQVAPTFSLADWFNQREQGMVKGTPSNQAPLISFDLAGPANGKPGYYNWNTKDFAPRLAIAWSPQVSGGWLKSLVGENKTTIRAGFGVVYDRLGQALLATVNQGGSFGMSTLLNNAYNSLSLATAPRVTGLNTIPTTDQSGNNIFPAPPPTSFPKTFPAYNQGGAFTTFWGTDDHLHTPYAYTLDFSIGRQLPHQFAIEASYVGRLSRRLLADEDMAMPLDLLDTKTGMDYFKAVTALAKVYRTGVPSQSVTSSMIGSAAQYWQDMLQPLTPGGAYSISRCTGGSSLATTSPVVAAYDLFCGFSGNETSALQGLDQGWGITDANTGASYYGIGGPYSYFSPQFASLYTWRSISNANYNALQVNLRKQMTQGVQFVFNYTYSKSIDISSDAQRVALEGGISQIYNAWSPNQTRAVSDYDTTHQFNANWLIELPFGRGKPIGRQSQGLLNGTIGGWQLSGLARWTSGFPVSIGNGSQWPTDWELAGFATKIGHPVARTTTSPGGTVNIFSDPTGPTGLGAFRADFPSESGTRNCIRGQGFAELDLGLSKSWKLPWSERQALKFRWEAFNVPNLVRFDVQSVQTAIDQGSFGNYSGLLTNPRVMQFALRYEF